MFRAVFITFHGEYRGGAQDAEGGHDSHGGHGGPHESPAVMVVPLVILAFLGIVSGWWNVTGAFDVFMGHGETHGFFEHFFSVLTHSLPLASLLVALAGIFLAYAMYLAKWISPEKIGSFFKPLYITFLRKYWMDELYETVIVRIAMLKGLFGGPAQIDPYVADGTVNGVGKGTVAGGRAIRHAQTGQLQLYGIFIGIGILAITVCVYLFG